MKKCLIVLIAIIALSANIVNAVEDTVISSENWEQWQKEDYWEWHTRTTTQDKAYNGKHIVIENDIINFYGYGNTSYKDFLYKEYNNAGKKIFKFRIDESKASYHTLDGAGFIFNANKVDNKISGYIVLFKEKNLCIYRIDNIDIDTFETKSNATLDTYGKLVATVEKTNSGIHDLVVEATPTKIKVIEGESTKLDVDLDYSIHSGESFGLISSYIEHDCSILSKIEFSQIKIILEDYKISVLNTDINSNSINGGYFELKDEEGQVIKEGKTNENGQFNVDGIKEGMYTIQQKKAPEGYILNENIYKFKVSKDGKIIDIETEKEIELIVKNEKIKTNTDENKNENVTSKEDNTISSISIPKAGDKLYIIFITIMIVTIFGIYFKQKSK